MDGRVTPALVEETTILVKMVKEVKVGLATKPVEVTDLKV